MPVELPPGSLPVQQRISDIISAYDDLFENWEDCLKIQIGGRDMLEAASSAKKDAAKKEDS